MKLSKIRSLREFTKLTWKEFSGERKNVLLLIFGIIYVAFYQTRQLSENRREIASDAITFSASVTETLQVFVLNHFPNTFWIFDWIVSLLYVFAFTFVLVTLVLTIITTGREAWRYGIALLACSFLQISLQVLVPVLVPIRWNIDIRPIRKEIWPWSEKLIGIKFGGIPSGHFGYSIFGVLLAKQIKYRRMFVFYLINSLLFPPIVLYLGEHYVVDLVASLILFPTLYYVVLKMITHYIGDTKHPNVFELAQKPPNTEHNSPRDVY